MNVLAEACERQAALVPESLAAEVRSVAAILRNNQPGAWPGELERFLDPGPCRGRGATSGPDRSSAIHHAPAASSGARSWARHQAVAMAAGAAARLGGQPVTAMALPVGAWAPAHVGAGTWRSWCAQACRAVAAEPALLAAPDPAGAVAAACPGLRRWPDVAVARAASRALALLCASWLRGWATAAPPAE